MWTDSTGTIYTPKEPNYSIDRILGLEEYTDYKFTTGQKAKGVIKGVSNEIKEDINNIKEAFKPFKYAPLLLVVIGGLIIYKEVK